jgi:hypothetical protein
VIEDGHQVVAQHTGDALRRAVEKGVEVATLQPQDAQLGHRRLLAGAGLDLLLGPAALGHVAGDLGEAHQPT